MKRAPSIARQAALLQTLRQVLVIAGADNSVLTHLQRRGLVRLLPLYDPRYGRRTAACAWQITVAGIAVSINSGISTKKRREHQHQIDIEDAIAASSSGLRL